MNNRRGRAAACSETAAAARKCHLASHLSQINTKAQLLQKCIIGKLDESVLNVMCLVFPKRLLVAMVTQLKLTVRMLWVQETRECLK